MEMGNRGGKALYIVKLITRIWYYCWKCPRNHFSRTGHARFCQELQ